MSTSFSIIIPTYNASKFISDCLDSIVSQNLSSSDIEVILVDDFSADNTCSIVQRYYDIIPNLKLVELSTNTGPGIARNEGLKVATNQWVIFLDSDDELKDNGIRTLQQFINNQKSPSLDVVGFDWAESQKSEKNLKSSQRIGRRDNVYFSHQHKLIEAYLSHRMDGSVIFTAMKRSLLVESNMKFDSGLHEDVDFIFNVYFNASDIRYFDHIIYLKRNHRTSIINTISEAHVEGYLRAWNTILNILKNAKLTSAVKDRYLAAYHYGTIGVIATRIREIARQRSSATNIHPLFSALWLFSQEKRKSKEFVETLKNCKTLYGNLCRLFFDKMDEKSLSETEKVETICTQISQLDGKSWSCTDLQHSVFMRSNEVRTCCKRFFVDGEMRGDVKLFDVTDGSEKSLGSREILEAKRELHQKINAGISNPCEGCSFLEFKKWDTLNKLDIHYLSLEYHSVCNLKCTYCSDEYYGGEKQKYDIEGSIEKFIEDEALQNCALVVWGGGEPVLGKGFEKITGMLAEKIPNVQQRVLSNSVKHSPAIDILLIENRGQLITSIDAGTTETFENIRGRDYLHRVCSNLKDYSEVNNKKITIKYIFTENNDSENEVRSFVTLMKSYSLQNCVFQISGDFKKEHVSIESATSMVLMFGLLKQLGCSAIYFDELLWHRLGDIFALNSPDYVNRLHNLTGFEFIATAKKYPRVIVWGAGQQAKYLVSKSHFFEQAEIAYFVDATPNKIGSVYFDKEVKCPSVLKESDLPIVIAAVQGYALIVEQFNKLGIDQNRLVNELII
ncbi:putative glycosyltransferase EpsJ [Paraglaciecola mesophila]|uniref:Putative glycosyltransferase EpsJ n=1 Tax=Paraglaciecola mesophila TaxID=197222 RepID=A0A857JQ34_9ALTE|nr:glycosyltransferase [Paraglaciecola mesophila]QHJ13586.1 putative glycosyltransferase EpsJ [Paraglaciecola mesophila]